jgi:hypothetical protein
MNDDPFARAVERAEAAERDELEQKRIRRQQQLTSGNRTAFRVHATVYLAVNLLLVATWYITWKLNDGTSYPWFIYVTLAWGIGLAAHWAVARNHLRRDAMAAQSGGRVPAVAMAKELSELARLHDDGSLSDEEFAAAKAKLLE